MDGPGSALHGHTGLSVIWLTGMVFKMELNDLVAVDKSMEGFGCVMQLSCPIQVSRLESFHAHGSPDFMELMRGPPKKGLLMPEGVSLISLRRGTDFTQSRAANSSHTLDVNK